VKTREYSRVDRFFGAIDKAIKVLSVQSRAARPIPISLTSPPQSLDESARLTSSRFLRVNHAGEVAAQALYQGQALTARSPAVAAALLKSANEELDHLAWCEQRIRELKGRTSLLNPLWYASSFALGALAGAFGDRLSLGFVAETENQVEAHLIRHLKALPAEDEASRVILEQMTQDEIQHGSIATALGGKPLPELLRRGMRLASKIMTKTSYWI